MQADMEGRLPSSCILHISSPPTSHCLHPPTTPPPTTHTHTPPPPAPLLTLTTLHPLDPPCPSRLPPQENTILLEKLVRIKMFDSGKIFKPWLGRSTFHAMRETSVQDMVLHGIAWKACPAMHGRHMGRITLPCMEEKPTSTPPHRAPVESGP